jgi:hypothetical protein
MRVATGAFLPEQESDPRRRRQEKERERRHLDQSRARTADGGQQPPRPASSFGGAHNPQQKPEAKHPAHRFD